jgi:hypothetical protein
VPAPNLKSAYRTLQSAQHSIVPFVQVSPPKLCMHLSSPHACQMPRPSHGPWLNHPNHIRWAAQIMSLLTMQLSAPSCTLLLALLSPFYAHTSSSSSSSVTWHETRDSISCDARNSSSPSPQKKPDIYRPNLYADGSTSKMNCMFLTAN